METVQKPLVTVFVPVHNGETYVEECLHAIQAQTWRRLEIIVVDDGSTDATAEAANRCARQDSRISVLRLPENVQLFHARLAGMEAAHGDYLLSVDVDDQISDDYVECLLDAALRTDADLVICDHLLMRTPDGSVRKSGLNRIPADREYLVPKEHVDYEYYRHNVGNAPIDQSYVVFWSKLYRRDLVERALPWLREECMPIIYNEDVLYAGVFLHLASSTAFTRQGTYVYGTNDASAMRSDFMERLPKIAADQLEVLYFLQRFLMRSDADPKLMDLFQAWKAGNWGFLETRYAYWRMQATRNS